METRLGQEMADKFPNFSFVHDPAFLTLKLPDRNESGFEVILRENPFYGGKANQAAAVVSLCQDGLKRGSSRLSSVIRKMAAEENRPTNEVSEDWLKKYLAISMKPVLWLYLEKGIALEAHQQNSIVKLKGGYPDRFYYRDNQGFYFCESKKRFLNPILPEQGKEVKQFVQMQWQMRG